ncbi:MAG: amidohydrolase family protein [Myxococcaceae bacterium]
MPRASLLALTVFCAACIKAPTYRDLLGPSREARVIFIRDAAVFTGTSTTLLEHQDVVVEGATIVSIAPTGSSKPSPNAAILEAAGKTVIPGLVDAHVHVTLSSLPPWYLAVPNPRHNVEALVFAGITTAQDLGGELSAVAELRNDILQNKQVGPRLFYAGPIITHRDGYPLSLLRDGYGPIASNLVAEKLATQVSSAQEARAAVRARQSAGASIIKLVIASIPRGSPQLTDEELDAVVAEAHLIGLKVIAHIDTADDAMRALDHHVDALAHGPATTGLTAEQAKRLADAKVTMVTTLINYERFTQVAQKRFAPLPMTVSVEPKEVLDQFSPALVDAATLPAGLFKWGDELEAAEKVRPVNVHTALDAGVTLVAGTDAFGSVGTFGADLHAELQLLVAAGVPNAEALLCATSRAAALLTPKPNFGTLAPGQSADLLVLDGNPLEDITATQRLVYVMARGQLLTRLPP